MTNLIIAAGCAFYLGTEYGRCKSVKLIKSLLEGYAKEGKTLQELIDDFNEADKSGEAK